MPYNFKYRTSAPTLYFGYGSNMWVDQMNRRCPENKYIGVGILRDWCWIINENGYANIIPSLGDRVYGLIYELSVKDEESLDKYEGVPDNYEKRTIPLKLITSSSNGEVATTVTIDTLVYTDVVRTKRGPPKTEYIHRMNMAIKDALENDISLSYIDTYLRPFIPLD